MTTVKIELDLNDRQSLLKQRSELARALEIIDIALRGFKGIAANGSSDPVSDLLTLKPAAIKDQLRNRFTIADVIAVSRAARPAAKTLISDWEKAGEIRLVERGKGRKAGI